MKSLGVKFKPKEIIFDFFKFNYFQMLYESLQHTLLPVLALGFSTGYPIIDHIILSFIGTLIKIKSNIIVNCSLPIQFTGFQACLLFVFIVIFCFSFHESQTLIFQSCTKSVYLFLNFVITIVETSIRINKELGKM